MLVDSWYDPYLGVVILVRVVNGVIKKGQNIKFMAGGTEHLVDRVGCMRPKIENLPELAAGEIGFITAQIKDISQTRVGDTITTVKNPAAQAAAGLQGSAAGGVLRAVPGRCQRLRQAARQHLQAAAQRCVVQLRDGIERGTGLRLPLRFPRAAAP